ncbi:MAG: hypothetical protein FJ280_01775 [Planctomycetes bacterium]|nr:hypothetical protein [Planctomycetota bacterium]
MQSAIAKELQELRKYLGQGEPQILAEALRLGIRQLWTQTILDHYAGGKISRRKARSLLGNELVERLDEERRFVLKDVRWGLADE